jgi:hypothetical protein
MNQVGSFQPRLEVGVDAHWRFSFTIGSRTLVSTGSVLAVRAIIRRPPPGMAFSQKACLNIGSFVTLP